MSNTALNEIEADLNAHEIMAARLRRVRAKMKRDQQAIDAVKTDIAPQVHYLKSVPECFGPMSDGVKTCDMRHNTDREFRVGDYIVFREYKAKQKIFTGANIHRRITHIEELICDVRDRDNGKPLVVPMQFMALSIRRLCAGEKISIDLPPEPYHRADVKITDEGLRAMSGGCLG